MALDAIVVGGGFAGSAIAGALAQRGHRVLVLERETEFRDRVRGENILPWGVDAARRLGVLDDLLEAGAHQPPWWIIYAFGIADPPRDLRATTPHGNTALNMYHPHLQQTLLSHATAVGAQVKRGATVVDIDARPDQPPVVTFDHQGRHQTMSARVVN